jgi:hypothetical protein
MMTMTPFYAAIRLDASSLNDLKTGGEKFVGQDAQAPAILAFPFKSAIIQCEVRERLFF